MFPLWLAIVIIFYFLSGYWLWKLMNYLLLLWSYNYYSLNTTASWLIGQKKNNRILYHQNYYLIEKSAITF